MWLPTSSSDEVAYVIWIMAQNTRNTKASFWKKKFLLFLRLKFTGIFHFLRHWCPVGCWTYIQYRPRKLRWTDNFILIWFVLYKQSIYTFLKHSRYNIIKMVDVWWTLEHHFLRKSKGPKIEEWLLKPRPFHGHETEVAWITTVHRRAPLALRTSQFSRDMIINLTIFSWSFRLRRYLLSLCSCHEKSAYSNILQFISCI